MPAFQLVGTFDQFAFHLEGQIWHVMLRCIIWIIALVNVKRMNQRKCGLSPQQCGFDQDLPLRKGIQPELDLFVFVFRQCICN